MKVSNEERLRLEKEYGDDLIGLQIQLFVEDYFMLFLSCTCLVFAYLILTR